MSMFEIHGGFTGLAASAAAYAWHAILKAIRIAS